jgi:hypothetical protein
MAFHHVPIEDHRRLFYVTLDTETVPGREKKPGAAKEPRFDTASARIIDLGIRMLSPPFTRKSWIVDPDIDMQKVPTRAKKWFKEQGAYAKYWDGESKQPHGALPFPRVWNEAMQMLFEAAHKASATHIVIIAHNGYAFDQPVLFASIARHNITWHIPEDLTVVWADSIPMARSAARAGNIDSGSVALQCLVDATEILIPGNAHTAAADADRLAVALLHIANATTRSNLSVLSTTTTTTGGEEGVTVTSEYDEEVRMRSTPVTYKECAADCNLVPTGRFDVAESCMTQELIDEHEFRFDRYIRAFDWQTILYPLVFDKLVTLRPKLSYNSPRAANQGVWSLYRNNDITKPATVYNHWAAVTPELLRLCEAKYDAYTLSDLLCVYQTTVLPSAVDLCIQEVVESQGATLPMKTTAPPRVLLATTTVPPSPPPLVEPRSATARDLAAMAHDAVGIDIYNAMLEIVAMVKRVASKEVPEATAKKVALIIQQICKEPIKGALFHDCFEQIVAATSQQATMVTPSVRRPVPPPVESVIGMLPSVEDIADYRAYVSSSLKSEGEGEGEGEGEDGSSTTKPWRSRDVDKVCLSTSHLPVVAKQTLTKLFPASVVSWHGTRNKPAGCAVQKKCASSTAAIF